MIWKDLCCLLTTGSKIRHNSFAKASKSQTSCSVTFYSIQMSVPSGSCHQRLHPRLFPARPWVEGLALQCMDPLEAVKSTSLWLPAWQLQPKISQPSSLTHGNANFNMSDLQQLSQLCSSLPTNRLNTRDFAWTGCFCCFFLFLFFFVVVAVVGSKSSSTTLDRLKITLWTGWD